MTTVNARIHLATRRLVVAALASGGDPVARWLRGRTADVYPLYEDIRGRGPLAFSRTGASAVTSRLHCDQLLRHPSFGVLPATGPVPDPVTADMPAPLTGSFLELDPPDHTRLRRLTAPVFRPAAMRAHTAWIGELADELADRMRHRLGRGEPADLMADFAAPFPITVISRLLGIPDHDAGQFRRIGALVGKSLDGITSIRQAEQLRRGGAALEQLFARLLEEKSDAPGDDVLSMLAVARADGRATARDAVEIAGLLLIAGFETTVNLIGNAVAALHDRPRHWHDLCADRSLASAAIEETLRWDPPVQGTARIAHAPAEVAGTVVPPGKTVLILLAAANRDPAVYSRPASFDPHRHGEPEHLAFSAGIHYCLGAALARIEGAAALRALAGALPRLELLPGGRRRRGATIRGYAHLPVTG